MGRAPMRDSIVMLFFLKPAPSCCAKYMTG